MATVRRAATWPGDYTGGARSFRFPTLEWPQLRSGCTVSLTVRGELTGRLTRNGSVDLTLSPTSALGLRFDRGAVTVARGGGSRLIPEIAPAEVVEVLLPPHTGRAAPPQCGPIEFTDLYLRTFHDPLDLRQPRAESVDGQAAEARLPAAFQGRVILSTGGRNYGE